MTASVQSHLTLNGQTSVRVCGEGCESESYIESLSASSVTATILTVAKILQFSHPICGFRLSKNIITMYLFKVQEQTLSHHNDIMPECAIALPTSDTPESALQWNRSTSPWNSSRSGTPIEAHPTYLFTWKSTCGYWYETNTGDGVRASTCSAVGVGTSSS